MQRQVLCDSPTDIFEFETTTWYIDSWYILFAVCHVLQIICIYFKLPDLLELQNNQVSSLPWEMGWHWTDQLAQQFEHDQNILPIA